MLDKLRACTAQNEKPHAHRTRNSLESLFLGESKPLFSFIFHTTDRQQKTTVAERFTYPHESERRGRNAGTGRTRHRRQGPPSRGIQTIHNTDAWSTSTWQADTTTANEACP